MDEKINLKLIIPLILLLLALGGGFYFWQKNKKAENTVANKSGGVVLGDTASQDVSTKIANGEIYAKKISETRTPINQGFEDLSSKAKYTSLFNSEEIQKIIDDTRQKTIDGIKTLQNLSLDTKFDQANEQEIKSLNLLLEAINAFDDSNKAKDSKEAQRLRELYSYDIEQSNKILKAISIPQ